MSSAVQRAVTVPNDLSVCCAVDLWKDWSAENQMVLAAWIVHVGLNKHLRTVNLTLPLILALLLIWFSVSAETCGSSGTLPH